MRKEFFISLSLMMLTACEPVREQPFDNAVTDSLPKDSLILKSVARPFVIYPDTALDRLSRFISGISQTDSNSYRILEDAGHWLEYSATISKSWERMEASRLLPMRRWEQDQLAPRINDSLTLFYPFGGPDLLHADVLYPHTKELILAGLEPITEVPDFPQLDEERQDQYLDSLAGSLRDVFGKSFFITNNMKKDLRQVRGVIPLFMIFISKTGHEITGLDYITVDESGNEQEVKFADLSKMTVKGLRMEYRNNGGGAVKKLYYFCGDVSNPGLASKKNLLAFLEKRRPFNTFIKSASYLMHQDLFSGIRKVVLENSASILEDDTGIPYSFLKGIDYEGFLFGNYVRPVKDFSWLDKQVDLDSAYQMNSLPLPFSLGYHWGSGKQNYMLFIRKSSIFAP